MAASACPPAFFSSCAWFSSSSESVLRAPRHVLLPTQLCRFRLSLLVPPPHPRHGSFLRPGAGSMSSPSSPADLEEIIKSKNSENAVVVYSKSWCPYCLRVKSLFKEVRTKPYVVELDELADEEEVQAALQRLTGQSTVPNVFIGGKHVGGCEDTLRLHHYKKLIPLLKEANAEFL